MAKPAFLTHLISTCLALLCVSTASAGTWQPVGLGDCPGRDVAGTRGPAPEAARCDASFVGLTAVCWTTGCTYKSVPTGQCTGGAHPGQMYTCTGAASTAPVAPAAPAAPAASPAGSSWQPVGVGDCPGRDVTNSVGPRPDPGKCNAGFAGNTAVCWTTGCTYKSVATTACVGGANPGQMYTCAVASAHAAAPPPPAPAGPSWQSAGVGDCPGRDVAGTAGSRPDPSKCNGSFLGNTAVCWTTGCTYKNVLTGQCIGGSNPGQMYTCAAGPTGVPAATAPPVSAPAPAGASTGGVWQSVGGGDCPGRDVANTRGPYPDASKCDGSFIGQTAVCWPTGCTYKNVPTAECTGGAHPGQVFTCAALGAAASPPTATSSSALNKRGKRYSVINFTGDAQVAHEFIVDWKGCKVAEVGPDFDSGRADLTIDVCRPGSRLIIKTEIRSTGQWIRYDWVVVDDGATLAGSYRDAATCGPSVGKRVK